MDIFAFCVVEKINSNQTGNEKHELALQFDEKSPLQFNSHLHRLCKIGSSIFIQGFSIDVINFTYNVFHNEHIIK